MQVPFLRDLLRQDWIFIRNNIKVDDLGPVLGFVGKLGDPELGGLGLEEFNRRQALYRQAEIAAMMDVPDFKCKAREIYGYRHLVNDVGGSLCELDEPRVIDLRDQLQPHPAADPVPPASRQGEELIDIVGIGPKIADQLRQAGVVTLADLAGLDLDGPLPTSIEGLRGRLRQGDWVGQARRLTD